MQISNKNHTRAAISDINVTPFVDVMLVLLIIFMVTAPMMQQGLEINLPETANSGIALNEDPFVLVINANGKIKIADTEVDSSNLSNKLKAIFEKKITKEVLTEFSKIDLK